MALDDTIAAISTPLGEGGLAIVRLSGPQALEIAGRCFQPRGRESCAPAEARTHTLQYGHIVRAGKTVDEVLLAVMRAPRTYTRQDTAEISCHGGLLPAKLVLDTVLGAGARAAEPGEFTLRAFLNGRLDLAQAEAVADVIRSRTELALAAAQEQLAGRFSQRIDHLRTDLVNLLAHLEAHLDFPEEDIEPDTQEQMTARLRTALTELDLLLRTANEGQLLRRGIRAAIIGRPNVGKSSLLNLLLGHERAIVSSIPGTTRDTVEETANIRGVPVVFIDTAGLREAGDEIEQEGIRRSHASIQRADLLLHVLDNSQPLASEEARYLTQFGNRPRIVVRNKADLPAQLELPHQPSVLEIELSCLTGAGLESLKDAMLRLVWGGEVRPETAQIAISSRHQDALRRAQEALERGLQAFEDQLPLDLVAADLHIGINAIGEIVGKTLTDDLLDSIFSQFCIGK